MNHTDYTIDNNGGIVTITDKATNIAICFKEKEQYCRYTFKILLGNDSLITTEDGVKELDAVVSKLAEIGEFFFPDEFAEGNP